jgi:hypothetical protein
MDRQSISTDAEVLRAALGRHAVGSAIDYAKALKARGDLEGAAYWQRLADVLREQDLVEA